MTFKAKSITTIGSKEFVDFPSLQLKNIPAKVDTGADSSTIWASKIKEDKGILRYVLFDQQSPFYTGDVLTTRNFKITSVRNSFGHSELRYKIKLKIVVAKRTIIVNFTLANRSHNRFPILIGRKTLLGKFLVDVSSENPKKSIDILMIVRPSHIKVINKFADSIVAINNSLKITVSTFDELDFTLGKHNKIILASSGRDISSFDMVYFKSTAAITPNQDITAAAAQYLKKRGVYFIDQSAADYPSESKLYQYVVLNDNHVHTPLSIFIASSRIKDSYKRFSKELGLPFIIKDIYSNKGKDNYLIDSEKAFSEVCNQVTKRDLNMVSQTYIDNDGDYRVLTLGRKIELVIYRKRNNKNNTHLNNVSKGGSARLAMTNELPGVIQKQSILAANLLKRDVVGVDMVQDKHDNSWYCLEVNAGPQLASGAFVNEKQVAFTEFIANELRR